MKCLKLSQHKNNNERWYTIHHFKLDMVQPLFTVSFEKFGEHFFSVILTVLRHREHRARVFSQSQMSTLIDF